MMIFRSGPLLHLLAFCVFLLTYGQVRVPQAEGAERPQEAQGSRISPDTGKTLMERNARETRERYAAMNFEEFEAKVYREPFKGGKYIVNGDTPILNKKQLKEFFEIRIKPTQDPGKGKLVVNSEVGRQDERWNSVIKHELTYCVSKAFGKRYDQVVADMKAAAAAWENVADVDFIHLAAEDGMCDPNNQNVVFDVRPVNVDGSYFARAFFPNEPRVSRSVLLDESVFQLDPKGKFQLVGILRHELGHTLGFDHEHTRPTAGRCFEDNNWRPLSDYDMFSVMTYPQCNGLYDWSLILTHLDKQGAACVYGSAAGFAVDPSICPDAGPSTPASVRHGPLQREAFAQQRIASREERMYGPFRVTPGALFEAQMQGEGVPGDPDLYVRFGRAPNLNQFDCRPLLLGADESCVLDVPSGQAQAFVMVHGHEAGSYTLIVRHTASAPQQ